MLLNAPSAVEFVEEELIRRTRANPLYSLRSYARDLKLSAGELSEILNRKRKLSYKVAEKIAVALGFSSEEEQHFYRLLRNESSATPTHGARQTLTVDLFRVISEWYCFAILNLAETKNFSWEPAYIAKRLGISPTEVKDALNRLERVGLIEKFGKDFRVAKDFIFTSEGVPSEAVRNYHKELLEKARVALDLQPVNERYFSGLGLSVDAKDLRAVHKDLGVFIQQMAKKYGNRKAAEIYQLEVGFFRLSVKE